MLNTTSYWLGISRTNSTNPFRHVSGRQPPVTPSRFPYAHWGWYQPVATNSSYHDCVLAYSRYAYADYMSDAGTQALQNPANYQTGEQFIQQPYGWAAYLCNGHAFDYICEYPAAAFPCQPEQPPEAPSQPPGTPSFPAEPSFTEFSSGEKQQRASSMPSGSTGGSTRSAAASTGYSTVGKLTSPPAASLKPVASPPQPGIGIFRKQSPPPSPLPPRPRLSSRLSPPMPHPRISPHPSPSPGPPHPQPPSPRPPSPPPPSPSKPHMPAYDPAPWHP